MAEQKLTDLAIIMNNTADNVAVAKKYIPAKITLLYDGGYISLNETINIGQRIALKDIKKGEYVIQYCYPFGKSEGIRKGSLVSIHNVSNVLPKIDIDKYRQPKKTPYGEKYLKRFFYGFQRTNGGAGTRNYYLVIPASMCASGLSLQAAYDIENNKSLIRRYSDIDGITAIPHTEGCGCDSKLPIERLLRVLKGYISHPNVGGCVIVEMGCEQSNREKITYFIKDLIDSCAKPIDWVNIQSSGGTIEAKGKIIKIIKKRLPEVNNVKRQQIPISKLIAGTECGASDSFSGITANPIIGNAIDKIVAGGGSAILTEMTELIGTFGMLLLRFRTLALAKKFKELMDWYQNIAKKLGLTLEANLVPKNIEGGLINNYIKSIGAVMKGGTTIIEDVIDYGEPVLKKGLAIMQGPGNDLESITGMVAGGANIICFSTGFGTTTGDAICPVIKIASNDELYKKMSSDMDFNAGKIISSNESIEDLGTELFEKIISIASGEKTFSEKWRQRQFQIWTAGKLSL